MIRLITNSRFGRLSTITAVVALVGVVAVAWAYFSSTGSGSASASVGTLTAPTISSATPGPGIVTLTWGAVDAPAGAGPVAYSVTRSAGGPASVVDCPTSSPTTVLSCTDSGLSAGSYSYTVTAIWQSWTRVSSATNVVVSSGAPAGVAVVSGASQSSTVNTAFADQLVAIVKDQDGNSVAGVSVTFTTPASGAGATFDPAGCSASSTATSCTVTTNSSGDATSSVLTANIAAGGYDISATVPGVSGSATFAEANNAAQASSLSPLSGSGQSATVATAFTSQIVATALDQYGNPVPGVSVTFSAPTAGARAIFAASGCTANAPTTTCTVTTDATGNATSSILTAGTVSGGYSVSASAGGLSAVAFDLTNTAGPAASVTVSSGSPQSATVGTDFASAFVALVTDTYGNPVAGADVTFTAPSAGASGTFAGGHDTTTATTGADGRAASSTFTANTAAGGPYAVVATVAGVSTN